MPGDLQLYEAPGCDACEGMGFVGRVGIFEFLEMSEPIRELIRAARLDPGRGRSWRARPGCGPCTSTACCKCLAGITTLEEVCSVTSEDW